MEQAGGRPAETFRTLWFDRRQTQLRLQYVQSHVKLAPRAFFANAARLKWANVSPSHLAPLMSHFHIPKEKRQYSLSRAFVALHVIWTFVDNSVDFVRSFYSVSCACLTFLYPELTGRVSLMSKVSNSWTMEDQNRPQRKLSRAGDSLYKALGLEKGASAEDIKKAYRCVPGRIKICAISFEDVQLDTRTEKRGNKNAQKTIVNLTIGTRQRCQLFWKHQHPCNPSQQIILTWFKSFHILRMV